MKIEKKYGSIKNCEVFCVSIKAAPLKFYVLRMFVLLSSEKADAFKFPRSFSFTSKADWRMYGSCVMIENVLFFFPLNIWSLKMKTYLFYFFRFSFWFFTP